MLTTHVNGGTDYEHDDNNKIIKEKQCILLDCLMNAEENNSVGGGGAHITALARSGSQFIPKSLLSLSFFPLQFKSIGL